MVSRHVLERSVLGACRDYPRQTEGNAQKGKNLSHLVSSLNVCSELRQSDGPSERGGRGAGTALRRRGAHAGLEVVPVTFFAVEREPIRNAESAPLFPSTPVAVAVARCGETLRG